MITLDPCWEDEMFFLPLYGGLLLNISPTEMPLCVSLHYCHTSGIKVNFIINSGVWHGKPKRLMFKTSGLKDNTSLWEWFRNTFLQDSSFMCMGCCTSSMCYMFDRILMFFVDKYMCGLVRNGAKVYLKPLRRLVQLRKYLLEWSVEIFNPINRWSS